MSAQHSLSPDSPQGSVERVLPLAPARRGRITPEAGNPAGYPPFRNDDVLGYTNRQIQYYLRHRAVPQSQITAFAKLCEQRQRINQSIGLSGDTSDESDAGAVPVQPVPRRPQPRQPTRARTSETEQPRSDQGALSYEDNEEPDSDYPAPIPGAKGVKIDNRITQLKEGGGLSNFNLWRNDLYNAFAGDPNRFTTGGSRVLLAIANMNGPIRALHAASARRYPLLRTHWRKFLRWVEGSVLHGEADRASTLSKYTEARQGATETPAQFYNRLLLLATELDQDVGKDDLFPRLQKGLQNTMLRSGRLQGSISEMVHQAQVIWGTFKSQEGSEKPDGQKDRPKSGRGRSPRPRPGPRGAPRADQGRRQKLSWKERERRQEEGACFRCGKTGHIMSECRGEFNPNPPIRGRGQRETRDPPTRTREQREDGSKAKAYSLKRGRSRTSEKDWATSLDTDDDSQPTAKQSKNE
jgi:hypothetical protein